MCSNDELAERIEDAKQGFDKAIKKLEGNMSKRMKGVETQVGEASSNAFNASATSAQALEEVKGIRTILDRAHVVDAAKIVEGGEKLSGWLISLSKVIVAFGIIYASFTHISWVGIWNWLIHWRVH